jgi:hypothetical protein
LGVLFAKSAKSRTKKFGKSSDASPHWPGKHGKETEKKQGIDPNPGFSAEIRAIF